MSDIADDILESNILIVTDDGPYREMMTLVLRKAGYDNLHFVNQAAEGVSRAEEIMPNLIVMDMMMPDMDGIALCEKIRDLESFKDIPLIMHSCQSPPEERARIFEAGATEIFSKPVAEGEVINRVRMHLEYSLTLRGLTDYHNRLTRDLDIARSMQGALLPAADVLTELKDSYDIGIVSQYEASDELGGDFWGVEPLDEDRLFVYVTDFAGHGISAALNTFRLHSLISNYKNRSGFKVTSPAFYLENLNNDLHELLPVEQYATMLCGIIDMRKNTFSYASAASTTPVILRTGTREARALDPSGFPLGMMKGATYEVREEPFVKGDMLFLYSDVLVESEDQMGRMIGEEQFMEMCKDTSMNLSPGQPFLSRFQKLFDMYVVRPLKDDLTAVTLERL